MSWKRKINGGSGPPEHLLAPERDDFTHVVCALKISVQSVWEIDRAFARQTDRQREREREIVCQCVYIWILCAYVGKNNMCEKEERESEWGTRICVYVHGVVWWNGGTRPLGSLKVGNSQLNAASFRCKVKLMQRLNKRPSFLVEG